MSGFFKSLEKGISSLGRDVSREVNQLGREVNRGVDSVWSSPILDLFKNGNVVQLVSRSSGHCLQIVMSSTGVLVADGNGPEGPAVYHAHWTIINEGQNIIRLHNNNNYIAIVNGATVVGLFPQPGTAGPETRFRVSQTGNFVMLESIQEPGRRVGVLTDGSLKSAVATGTENDAQFGAKLIYTPHVTVVTTTTSQPQPKTKK